jgi:hypothetical protein
VKIRGTDIQHRAIYQCLAKKNGRYKSQLVPNVLLHLFEGNHLQGVVGTDTFISRSTDILPLFKTNGSCVELVTSATGDVTLTLIVVIR